MNDESTYPHWAYAVLVAAVLIVLSLTLYRCTETDEAHCHRIGGRVVHNLHSGDPKAWTCVEGP